MITTRSLTFVALSLGLVAACNVPIPHNTPDAAIEETPDAMEAPPVDAPPPPEPVEMGQTVTGNVVDFRTGTPLGASTVKTDGAVNPANNQPLTATTDGNGNYELDHVPSSGSYFPIVTRANYRATRNPAVTVAQETVSGSNLLAVSNPAHKALYNQVGMAEPSGKSVIVLDMLTNNGSEALDIDLADIHIVDNIGQAVGGVTFLMDSNGTNPNITSSVDDTHGHARVAFINLTPGKYTITHPAGAQAVAVTINTFADGVVLASSADGSPATALSIQNPKFKTDIYPRLQSATIGGLGCGDCHNNNNTQVPIVYTDDVTTTYNNIIAAGTAIIADPTVDPTLATSRLLTMPLYEAPTVPKDGHPNVTFLDTNDPDYLIILKWLQNGAPM